MYVNHNIALKNPLSKIPPSSYLYVICLALRRYTGISDKVLSIPQILFPYIDHFWLICRNMSDSQ